MTIESAELRRFENLILRLVHAVDTLTEEVRLAERLYADLIEAIKSGDAERTVKSQRKSVGKFYVYKPPRQVK